MTLYHILFPEKLNEYPYLKTTPNQHNGNKPHRGVTGCNRVEEGYSQFDKSVMDPMEIPMGETVCLRCRTTWIAKYELPTEG